MNNLQILILEDEAILALGLANFLETNGCNVIDYVTTTQEAKEILDAHKEINLLFLDVNLGESQTGIDFYKSLKTNTLVIYLTAYKDDATISSAIQTEPLGYLVKPYADAEILALLKLASLKVQKNTPEFHVKLSHGYTFDTKESKLYKKKVYVRLGNKKLMLLKLLIEAKGNPVSFKQIEEEIYTDAPPASSSIRTLIYRLRNTLEDGMIESELNYGVKLM